MKLPKLLAATVAVGLIWTAGAVTRETPGGKTSLSAIAVKLPKSGKLYAEDYRRYVQATTYDPTQLTCPALSADPANDRLPVWRTDYKAVSEAEQARLRRFVDSLYIIDPEAGADGTQLLIKSIYPWAETPSEGRSKFAAEPFMPDNDKLSGLRFETGGVKAELIYAFYNDCGERVTPDPNIAWETSVRDSLRTESLRMWLEGSDFRDIRSGYFELNLLPAERYDTLRLSAADIGRRVMFGDVPLEVLDFGPGCLHLGVKFSDMRRIAGVDVDFFNPGETFYIGRTRYGRTLSREMYEEYRRTPGLSFPKFVKRFGSWSPDGDPDDYVMLISSNCNAAEAVLYIPQAGGPIASRIIVFSRDEQGEYSFSLPRRGDDGVLRPPGGNPEGLQPPRPAEGNEAMFRQIAQLMCYPPEAADKGIQGNVMVLAKIDAEGRLLSAEVMRRVHPLLDAEALRVVRQLEGWTSAVVDGKPAAMDLVIPIRFQLQ